MGVVTHGMTHSPTWNSYQAMKARCLNPKHSHFDNYGGRGIKVCDRWLDSFKNFLEDMGVRPEGYSLERKDNDGDYTPDNCKWASKIVQANNTRVTVYLTWEGETLSLPDMARKHGILPDTLRTRLDRGWDLRKALTSPVRARADGSAMNAHRRGSNPTMLEFDGVTRPLTEWANIYGLPPTALNHRIKRGWAIEKALTTPLRRKLTKEKE